jgi:mono/diheme cytochrome c family protein/plastocyanin
VAVGLKRPETLARGLVLLASLGVLLIPLSLYFYGQTDILHARIAENAGWTPMTLQARVGEPLHLRMTSDDVTHGFAVGQMDMQPVDIEPGRISEVTLTFDRPGTYTFYCTRWCGLNHWRMRGTIEVFGNTPPSGGTPSQPLFVRLGINLDDPHPADVTPATEPSASAGARLAPAAGPDLERLLASNYYRAHSPAQVFAELKDIPLTDPERWNLVAYVWRSNTTPQALEKGRQLFQQNCAACHGEAGAGNGVFAGQVAAARPPSMNGAGSMYGQGPADFTDPVRMLGASPALLQGKILRGGMGTGMPMWGSIFTDQQAWDVVAFLYSLQFNYQP